LSEESSDPDGPADEYVRELSLRLLTTSLVLARKLRDEEESVYEYDVPEPLRESSSNDIDDGPR
jgi:hypothetical protein